MVYRLEWIPANDSDNSAIPMLSAITELLKNLKPSDCPVCSQGKIRFYYATSEYQPEFVTKKREERGTIWVWCPSCLHWTHGSGIHLPNNITYMNTLKESEILQIKGRFIIDNLNRFWEKELLPDSFMIKK
jgi:hypothetical protein